MSADRNLLFGLLALQMDFVSRDGLLDAMHAWMARKSAPLGEILGERGALDPGERRLLDDLVDRHVQRHGDAARSLASVQVTPEARQQLEQLTDADVQAGVASLRCGVTAPLPQPDGAANASRRYGVLRPHARGGLGEVFVARDEELGREVALKQIQERFAEDGDSQRRFLREAEITGNLEHPGVVPVYGLLREGRPVYAMRFIHGESMHEAIARFHAADRPRRDPAERGLALRGLLGRFVAVCNAVGYAHSRGVIHRDLKPANVMLGEYGETLVVDWGLARELRQADVNETTAHRRLATSEDDTAPTQLGQALGTPAFMPPEQARGEHDRVGVRSDVWALGATLYALLTGQAPYAGGEALEQARGGAVVPPRQVKRGVPRALEAVCLKAMGAEPAGRYATARALAEEVEHWLADEPVSAYREPAVERARRWGRRHRTLVSSAMVLLAAGVVGLGLGLWAVNREKQRTAQERDSANEARELAEAAQRKASANFERARQAVDECFGMAKEDKLFQAENMRQARKRLLEKTLPFYEGFVAERADDEALLARQAEYLDRVAYVTQEIDRKEAALRSYERARDIYQRLSQAHPEVTEYEASLAAAWGNLGNLQRQTGKPQEALKSYTRAHAIQHRLSQAHPEVTRYQVDLAGTWNNLGNLQHQTGKPQEALKSYTQARDIQLRLHLAHPEITSYQADLAQTWYNLGSLQHQTGKPQEALVSYAHARDIQHRLSQAHPEVTEYQADLARSWNNLGNLQSQTGKPQEALTSYTQARDVQHRLSQAHPEVTRYQVELARTWNNLGLLQSQTGKPQEAPKSYAQARDILHRLSQAHPEVTEYQADLARSWNSLGNLQSQTGKPQEALKSYTQARDIQRRLSQAHPEITEYQTDLAGTWNNLGLLQSETGKPQEALVSYAHARDIQRRLSQAHPEVPRYQATLAGTHLNLANLQRASGQTDEALKSVAQAIARLQVARQREPLNPTYRLILRNAHYSRADTLGRLNRHRDAAADWGEALRLNTDAAARPFFRLKRADALARTGDYRQAMAEADDLARGKEPSAGTLYNLGCVVSLAAAAVARDQSRPLPERDRQADLWARQAVALLQRAARAGFFGTPANRAHLDKDADLAFLRGRDDFRAFVATLPPP